MPLFFALQGKSQRKAFLLSYLAGIIFWFGIIYWLIHVTFAGLIVLVLYLAVYFGVFGLLVSAISHKPLAISQLIIPSAWVLLEHLRSHLFTGFPWALLAYSQYLNLPIIQIADITGAWGVSFLVMMVNVAVYSLLANRCSLPVAIKKYLAVWLSIIFAIAYGYYRLNLTPDIYNLSPIKISLIQGNIPQDLKWNVRARDSILGKYFALTKQAAVKDNPDLIIWPEASLPAVLEEEPVFFEQIKNFVQEIKTPLLFGAVTFKEDQYYNSALLLSSEAKLLNQYDKLHLVPFGEYIPLRKVFRFLETVVPIGDLVSGREHMVFRHNATTSSVLICFEDIFPELAPRFMKKGAQFLINITNDAWFGRTSAPYQHFQASVFRAVENRVYVVRSANTGVSGFIAPTGKIIALVKDASGREIFISGYKTEKISIPKGSLTFYTRYADIFIVFCLLLVLYGIIVKFKK